MGIQQQAKQYLERRWARRTAIGVIVFAAFFSLVPVVIKMVVKDWYQDQGVESIQIEDVDFNFFTGKIAFEGFKVVNNSETVFSMEYGSVNVSWVDLLFKKINIEEINLRRFFIDVNNADQKQMQVAGIRLGGEKEQQVKESDDEGSSWGFGLTELSFDGFDVKYSDAKISSHFTLHKAHLNNVLTWTPDQHAVLALNGEVNQSPVSISAELKPFSVNPYFKTRIKIEGLELGGFKELAKPNLSDFSGKLSLETDIEAKVETDKSIQVKADGKYQLDTARVELPDKLVEFKQLRIVGPLEVNHLLNSKEEERTAITFAGELGANDISINDSVNQIRLLDVGRLLLKKLDVNKLSNIKIESTSLDNLKFGRLSDKHNKPIGNPVVAVKSAQLNSLKLSSFNLLNIENIKFDELVGDITKNKKGELVVLSRLGKEEETSTDKKNEESTEGKVDADDSNNNEDDGNEIGSEGEPFLFKVGEITVSGKSSFSFSDNNVIPKFDSVFKINKMQVRNVDNTDSNSETAVSLKGSIGKYGKIDVDGKTKLFADKKYFTFKIDLKNYELPPLSSYTSQILGYDLLSGQGNVNVEAVAKQGDVSGEAKLVLNNLTVKVTDPEHLKELNEQLSIPLDLALSLLRDGNDDIKLTIPVTGALLKPDVDIGDVINTALGNAMKGATMAYLKYAFQPFGTLISIVEVAGKAAGSIQLDPVLFEPGDAQFNEETQDYFLKIAKLLREREGIRIKLCGVSTEADRKILLRQPVVASKQSGDNGSSGDSESTQVEIVKEKLFSLAKQRAENVKDHLVTEFKLKPERLFVCHPQIKKEVEAKPSVELLI